MFATPGKDVAHRVAAADRWEIEIASASIMGLLRHGTPVISLIREKIQLAGDTIFGPGAGGEAAKETSSRIAPCMDGRCRRPQSAGLAVSRP